MHINISLNKNNIVFHIIKLEYWFVIILIENTSWDVVSEDFVIRSGTHH